MKHLICTRKIYIDEGYRVFVSYGAQRQSSQWQSHFKSSAALCSGWRVGWMDWGAWDEGRGRYLAGECHHHNRSRQCHTLVTEQRPVCHLTQQPNDKDASPSGFVMSGRTAPLCPSFTPPASPAHHPILITEGDWRESGLCGEHKAPSSVTNDQNTKVNTPLVI